MLCMAGHFSHSWYKKNTFRWIPTYNTFNRATLENIYYTLFTIAT